MIFNDNCLHHYTIKNQSNTIGDIKKIVATFYDLGTVKDVHRLILGETNFNYDITLEKYGKEKKCFGQLFSTAKPLKHVKHELALREYYMKNRTTDMKCALHYQTKDGGYTIICHCSEIQRERHFVLFEFIEGSSPFRDEWAFGQIPAEMLRGAATGLANYHVGAYGFKTPVECEGSMMTYSEELKYYKKVFTEEFERCRANRPDYEYYQYFADYQDRLLEIMDRCTAGYEAMKNEIPVCICQIDTSCQNYLFDDSLQPLAICDLDWSQERLRLFDLCWFINEGLCHYDHDNLTNFIDFDEVNLFLEAYDEAIEKAGGGKPGKLTAKEREMLPEIYQLVSIRCGFYNIWVYILTDNPSNKNEYNTYWGNWSKTAMEFVEEHMEEFKEKLKK